MKVAYFWQGISDGLHLMSSVCISDMKPVASSKMVALLPCSVLC